MKRWLLVLLLVGCSGEQHSFDTVETARLQAKENATFVANQWRNNNAPKMKISVIGDSTISGRCPQGDGWSTVHLLNDTGRKVDELKCSTVSLATGCLRKAFFQERDAYASQEGHCNKDVPHPLPKIVR